jgi:ubiquinone/menaquinone biosynthesis C-methylase UbiE
MIKLAKENAKKEKVVDKIKFRKGDATKIPFPKNSFDAVISFNALHHTESNFRNVITEMFRVSKNKVIITELNETGAKIFDEYLRPEEKHREMILNLNELRDFLKKYSTAIKVLERKSMSTFVCESSINDKNSNSD